MAKGSKVEKMEEKQEMKWKIENDLRTLREAAEITSDKPRYMRALKMAEEQKEDMTEFIKNTKGLRSK